MKDDKNLDQRNIENGSLIYQHGYCDQPYVVIAKDGTWVCTFTTSASHEGAKSQYIVATMSKDQGKTWSEPVEIEPHDGYEASWAMPLINENGRIYVFYDYNGDNIQTLPDGKPIRTDMIGWYCYKYSDDNGKTWSDRYRLPVRITACDRGNNWNGKVQIMWGIGKPIFCGKTMFFAFTKLGRYMLEDGEGWFFCSDNILFEKDVSKIEWQMLPDGDYGLRSPEFGSVQEEHNIVSLSDGDLYCMYRTTIGHPVNSYSRDRGHSWLKPEIATYANGRPFKNPRACPRIWKTKNGNFLFWFHNHSGRDFTGRNPAWLSGGIEKDGVILWSQPEIVLYSPDLSDRLSYPDLIEQNGRYWITTTQKTRATVHEIDRKLLEGLWNQDKSCEIAQEGLILSLDPVVENIVKMPILPDLSTGGFSIDLWVKFDELTKDQIIFDSKNENGKGICLLTTEKGTVKIDINDGKNGTSWDCDQDILDTKKSHHIVVIVDGGPNIITFVVDGIICDGGKYRQYGWGRFSESMTDVNGNAKLTLAKSLRGGLESLRIYNRYLRNSEAIANFNNGKSLRK